MNEIIDISHEINEFMMFWLSSIKYKSYAILLVRHATTSLKLIEITDNYLEWHDALRRGLATALDRGILSNLNFFIAHHDKSLNR